MTTPFEREILTHFYVRPDGLTPFERITDLYHETVRGFIKLGLLKYDISNDVVAAVKPALEAYMAALAAVPLPHLGANVIYANPQGGEQAAIVVKVRDASWVALKVFDGDLGFDFFVSHAEMGVNYHWPKPLPSEALVTGPLDWSGLS